MKEAIFYNCKYEVKFAMKKKGVKRTIREVRTGIIAHDNMVAIFNQNVQDCFGLMGNIDPLTEEELRNETLSSWLWEHDF